MLRRSRTRPRSQAASVWIFTTALFAVSAALWLGVRGEEPSFVGGPSLPLWVLALAFLVAEVFVMHIRIARHAQKRMRVGRRGWNHHVFFAAKPQDRCGDEHQHAGNSEGDGRPEMPQKNRHQ